MNDITEKFDGVVNHETISEMMYLEACIKVVGGEGEGKLAHIKIQKGTFVRFLYHLVHHDPELWLEPERFRSERFLKENVASILPFSFVAFGSGPRQCLGKYDYT